MTDSYSTIHISIGSGVADIVLDNPPVNALSAGMMRDLTSALAALAEDPAVRVIVFSSADPKFFLAHVDMRIAEHMDVLQKLAAEAPTGVNVFQAMGELLRQQPQVTIVKLAGIARGGGAEFVAAADLTFAATETAGLGQIETLMGIVPSGGGSQYLLERTGRNRALEIILTGDLYDAATAAAYGWINRAVPSADLDVFVADLSSRIAALPAGVVEAAKRVLRPTRPIEGYRREEAEWGALISKPATQALMAAALERGAQTRDGEADLEGLMRSVDS